jgi:hypothetical protein
MTPANVIDSVRRVVRDGAFLRTPDAYSAATLLVFVNNTIKRMVMLRPDLFTTVATISTTPNVVMQSMPSDSFRLVDIFQVTNGNTLEEVDRTQFNRTDINWAIEPAAAPVKFMRHPRNPNRYFLYPRPITGTTLEAEYVKVQPTYNLNDNIVGLPDDYLPAVVDGTLYNIVAIENEMNPTQLGVMKVKMYWDSFTQSLGLALQTRDLIDKEVVPDMGQGTRTPQQAQ